MLEAAVRKMAGLNGASLAEREAFMTLPFREAKTTPNFYLIREGEVATHCCILLSGYACRQKLTSGGKRQILSFHLPGDILDLQHLKLPLADHNVETITSAHVAWVAHAEIDRYLKANPRVADALWRESLREASIFREWVLNVGRRDGRERLAHMLCEFAVRREAAGLGSPDSFELPMSQADMADATGMSVVHVNRTLRVLVEDGAIGHRGRELRIIDWERLQTIADFNPAYLHLAA